MVHLYIDEGQLGRRLVLVNGLQEFARGALAEIAARLAWTVQEFDLARAQLHRQHPEPWDLWRAIGRETV